jgi:hypothetical protein
MLMSRHHSRASLMNSPPTCEYDVPFEHPHPPVNIYTHWLMYTKRLHMRRPILTISQRVALHSVLFVLTGVLSTIGAQWLLYHKGTGRCARFVRMDMSGT